MFYIGFIGCRRKQVSACISANWTVEWVDAELQRACREFCGEELGGRTSSPVSVMNHKRTFSGFPAIRDSSFVIASASWLDKDGRTFALLLLPCPESASPMLASSPARTCPFFRSLRRESLPNPPPLEGAGYEMEGAMGYGKRSRRRSRV
jgi:hypothetical protein